MRKDDRKLTKKEEKRLNNFNKITKNLEKDGYKKVELTVSTTKANIAAILYSLPFILVFGALFLVFNHANLIVSPNYTIKYLIFIIIFLIAIVVHELIHGVTFSIFSKNHFKDIDFGIVWKDLTPYCTCTNTIHKKGYLLSLSMPFLVLGVIPSIISIFTGSVMWFAFGAFMILGAGGDLMIVFMILNYKNKKDALYLDHPTDVGVVLFER